MVISIGYTLKHGVENNIQILGRICHGIPIKNVLELMRWTFLTLIFIVLKFLIVE